MTKNDYYDQSKSYGETNSLSEIARKLRTGFATCPSEHGESGRNHQPWSAGGPFVDYADHPFMNSAVRRWLFIMPQDWTWWVWLVTACLLLIGLMGMPDAFSPRFCFRSLNLFFSSLGNAPSRRSRFSFVSRTRCC